MLLAQNFDINIAKGLSEAEAAQLLKDVGYNELPSAKPRSVFAIAFEVAKEPMFLLLVAGGLVYLLLGDLQEALMLLGFVLVIKSVRLGRRIFDNIKKAMAYILAIHVPIAGMSLIPVLLEWPLIFFPIQVVFLELIIDPACSIAFEAEPEEADVMNRSPRDPNEPLFNRRTLGLSFLQGISVLIIVLAVFAISLYHGQSEAEARTLTYVTLIIANLGLILTNRSWSRTILETVSTPNPALWWVIGGALAFLALVIYVPFIRELFGFAYLHFIDIAICFMAGITSIIWFECLKVINRSKDLSMKQN